MALFNPEDRAFAEKAADLVTTNPFHANWIKKERDILGQDPPDEWEVFSWQPGWGLWGPRPIYPDLVDLGEKIVELGARVRSRLQGGASATKRELGLYETLAMYALYRKHGEDLDLYIDAVVHRAGQRKRCRRPTSKRSGTPFKMTTRLCSAPRAAGSR